MTVQGQGMTYGGVRNNNVTVLERGKAYWAPRANESVEVRGRPGALFRRRNVEPRPIPVTVMLEGEEGIPFEQTAQEFADWLNAEEPQPLQFDNDALNRTYYAILNGAIDPHEVVQFAKIELEFICYDPHAYGPERYSDITEGGEIDVLGSDGAEPITTITLSGDTTYLAVSDGEQMNMVGQALDVDEKPVNPLQLEYWSEADNTVGWTAPATVEEGAIAGEMYSDGYRFMARSYGTGTGWHGPALKRALPEQLTNFQVDALVELFNLRDYKARGKIIVSGLDALNRVVFSMSMGDGYNTPRALGLIRMGDAVEGKNIVAHIGEPPSWNDFKGMLRVGRIGQTWYAYVARVNMATGKHDVRLYREYKDNGAYDRKLTQIQVQLMGHASAPIAVPRLEDVKVYRRQNVSNDQVPIIGVEDDIFEFNHKEGVILKNGEDFTAEKAFIGSYFDLEKGKSVMVVEPSDVIKEATVRWRDRWK